jgi:hypothetical protein
MGDQSSYWGEVRAWTHQAEHDFTGFEELFARVEIEPGEPLAEVVQYIAQNFSLKVASFEELARHFKTRYLERFEKRAESLRQHPLVTDVSFSPNPPVAQEVIDRAERDWGITLPAEILDFYRSMDGFTLEWESTAENNYAKRSRAQVNTLERVFGGFSGMNSGEPWEPWVFDEILTNEWVEDEYFAAGGPDDYRQEGEFDYSLNFRSFWVESVEGVSDELGVCFDESKTKTQMIYFSRLEPIELMLDFDGYIENMLAFMGYSYWPFMFIEREQLMGYHVNSLHPDVILEFFPEQRERLQKLLADTPWAKVL